MSGEVSQTCYPKPNWKTGSLLMPGGTYRVGWDMAKRIHFIVKEGSDKRIIYSDGPLSLLGFNSANQFRRFSTGLVCASMSKPCKYVI